MVCYIQLTKKINIQSFKKDKIFEALNKGSRDYVSSSILKLLFNEMGKH